MGAYDRVGAYLYPERVGQPDPPETSRKTAPRSKEGGGRSRGRQLPAEDQLSGRGRNRGTGKERERFNRACKEKDLRREESEPEKAHWRQVPLRRLHPRSSPLPEFHDGGVVEVFLGGALDVVVGFAGGGGGRQGDAELIGEVERKAEILVHQSQREAWDVFAFEQIRRLYVQYTRAGHAGLQDFHEFFALQACAGDKRESFGEGINLEREDQVHGELDGLPGAVGPEVKPFLAHHAEDGLGVLQRGCVAADHEKQFAFLGAPIAAGDGRVQKTHTAFYAGGGNFAGERRGNGAGIDVGAAALERLHGAAGSPEDFFEGGRIADHGDKKIGSGSTFLRRFGELGSGGD